MVTGKQYADEALKIFAIEPQAGYIWGTSGVLWTQKRQENLNKTTDANRALSRRYGKKWIGHYVWDCSGLTSYCGKKLGLKYHHGSDSSYRLDCSHKGRLTKSTKLPIGAWVYTGTDSKKPHIGVYTGDGMVTEANGTIKGVIKTKLYSGRWLYWGLGKGIEFEFIPGVEPDETKPIEERDAYPILKKGSKSEYVALLQKLLTKDGNVLEADGIFGPITLKCVKTFQTKHRLVVDGIVGPKTWAELLKME